ncbi:MAG: hypothetical protein ACI83W_001470 [Marinoscillum sp.]|jgi:uncharacterized protein (TIGR02231 family)
MRSIFFIASIAISFHLLAKDVVSKIEKVEVFLNQAEINRKATVALTPSTSELVFTGLSNQLDQNSIQVKAQGDFVIMSTSFRLNYLNQENPSDRMKSIQTQIANANKNEADINGKIAALIAEENLLKANQVIGGGASKVTTAELKAMADFFKSRLLDISTQTYALNLEKEEVQKLLKQLQNQLNEISNKDRQVAGELVVTIENSKSQNASFDISYVVNGASWSPSYDLRAGADLGELQLVYKASIFQNTGEDWDNVQVSLSTSNPSYGGSLPVLSPWYLDFAREEIYRSKQASMRSSQEFMLSDAVAESAPVADEAYDFVELAQSLISVNYKIGKPVTISSHGKPALVSIREEKVMADFQYRSVPSITDKVYLIAKLKEWGQLNLLPGYLNVFYDGGFINKTYINLDASDKSFMISFGVDERIAIQRKVISDYTDDQTIGTKRRVSKLYEYVLKNNKSLAIDIEVLDQLPKSKNDDIEILNIVLAGGSLNPDNGEVTWKYKLEPNAEKKWKMGYEVKYPKDRKVNGL